MSSVGDPTAHLGYIRSLDASEIKDVISHHEQAIVVLEDKIAALSRSVRQLQFQRLRHKDAINYCKGMITLATRMPTEILAFIFDLCSRDGYTRTPLVVSHVCSQWRKATLVPSVWSVLYVNIDSRDPYGRTHFWLEKAQDSWLSISIDVGNKSDDLERVMGLLVGRISQWKNFKLHSVFLRHANYILNLCRCSSPELLTIDVTVVEEDERGGQAALDDEAIHQLISLQDAFPNAPQLFKTSITRNIVPPPGLIPSNIRNLNLVLPSYDIASRHSVPSILRCLEELPLLKQFSMTVSAAHVERFRAEEENLQPVNLPELEFITLVGLPDVFRVLPYLHTPALRCLHLRLPIDLLGYTDSKTGAWLKDFLRSSSPPLEILELRDIDIPLEDFITCFTLLPHLQELRLHESEISEAVIYQLNGSNGLCPELRKLDLRWCGQITGQALVNLVRSRTTKDDKNVWCSISEVTIINCSFVKEEDIMELAELTVCRVTMYDTGDLCRPHGCCQNDRYRRRLALRTARHSLCRRSYNPQLQVRRGLVL
ncbi:hypothetical protein BDQ17DRAFT_1238899 [Cyathus striatus]|nr:hypothetical protein BDQ17DRAFT_1238899 [Cyathus striatus]